MKIKIIKEICLVNKVSNKDNKYDDKEIEIAPSISEFEEYFNNK